MSVLPVNTCQCSNLLIGRRYLGTFSSESHTVERDDNNLPQHGVAWGFGYLMGQSYESFVDHANNLRWIEKPGVPVDEVPCNAIGDEGFHSGIFLDHTSKDAIRLRHQGGDSCLEFPSNLWSAASVCQTRPWEATLSFSVGLYSGAVVFSFPWCSFRGGWVIGSNGMACFIPFP